MFTNKMITNKMCINWCVCADGSKNWDLCSQDDTFLGGSPLSGQMPSLVGSAAPLPLADTGTLLEEKGPEKRGSGPPFGICSAALGLAQVVPSICQTRGPVVSF